jgi:hypothetical protein
MKQIGMALALGLMSASLAHAQAVPVPSTAEVARSMEKAANQFLSLLDESKARQTNLSFDDPRRVDWHNIPKPTRKGLSLRDMKLPQQEACHELLRSALSESGYEKAVRIMALENNLKEGEKNLVGSPLRDPFRYYLTIFGQPGSSGRWGWSFEGHHFSLNFVIDDGQVVAHSPSFWGANPATVKIFVEGGPAVGTRTLADEEQIAFDLTASMTKEQQERAIIANNAPADYRGAGVPSPPRFEPIGLAVADMTETQKKLIASLLNAYTSHLAGPLALQRQQEIQADGLDKIYFGWAGAVQPGKGHYYRVQGPSFVLELVNIQADPAGNLANHIHSVWRDPRGDFGVKAN